MGDREALLEMGFEQDRVDWALQETKSSGMQAALDHLEAHQDEPMPENWREASEAPASEAPKSIRCRECDKVFRDMDLAMYHADKSGHDDFEESTEEIQPLTEEEKQQRLAELRHKLQEKRAANASKDADERRANEQIRRKAGQDAGAAREELERKERIKEAERKRREKADDIAAKARVKAQIEEDKRARAEKAAREKALREGTPLPGAAPQGAPAPPPTASVPRANAGTEARLRVRAPGGQWMGTLPADATLADLEKAVLADGKGGDASALQFSSTFPRRTFGAAERQETLKALGLVPNAALDASSA
ncbi:uncharacterized protein MJAP1_000324 [Malassezia japonica]|uniref:UBA domain-containing protein n=1 Tax=Malassezia japonica TaxID=223818 RepID=A0AAF0J8R6_9BASI|nr:uncharacterized protein MJAP1_000324 [Malassezia japonica]WFD37380.1 hypothetical protein MJAP1_000324 [Malassezia japonica]